MVYYYSYRCSNEEFTHRSTLFLTQCQLQFAFVVYHYFQRNYQEIGHVRALQISNIAVTCNQTAAVSRDPRSAWPGC